MRIIAVTLTALLIAGCSRSPASLPNSHDSPEALARAVLEAIERRDVQSLNSLAINEQEFQAHVWPELPASRPERRLPFSYVWGDLHQKSNAALTQTLARHGGRKHTLLGMNFVGETTSHETYRVHRKSEVTLRDGEGHEHTARLFGSALEEGGRFKVFSYVIDD
jgi:hypothetical protein